MRNYIEDTPDSDEPVLILPELHQDTLLALMNIPETTIRANRAGKLTRDQQDFVHQHMKNEDDSSWLLTRIFMGTSVLLAFIFVMQGLATMAFILGGGLFAAVFGLFAYRLRQKRVRDLSERVSQVKGTLRVIKSEQFDQWALVIENKFFRISSELANTLAGYDAPIVAAYYTEGSDTLLSMEVLALEKRKNDDIHAEGEQSLAAWDKPKNTLALDDTPAVNEDERLANDDAPAQQEQASGSKRRF